MAKSFKRLTRTVVRKLQPGEKITEHGISLERRQDGDGVYSVNIMVDGQRIHRVVGRESEGTTRTQAEEFIAKVRTDAKHDRLTLPKGRKVALSFRKAAKKYVERLKEEDGKDIEKKARRLELHLVPFFGDLPLSKITTFDIERYKKLRRSEKAVKSCTEKGIKTYKDSKTADSTVNRELAVLSHLLNKAVEWGWLPHMPAKIRRLKEENGRITYLTVEQIQQLVECSKSDQNAQIYPFILIALDTSMRLGEVLAIRKEHVDLANRRIFIPKAKAGAREQPITQGLADYLQSYMAALPEGLPWLFASPSAKEGHTVNIRKPFRRVAKAAGLDPDQIVRHTLRHTAITHLVQAGVDLPTIKRISGHKTLAMVERYAHANGEHIQSAMDKLSERYKKVEEKTS